MSKTSNKTQPTKISTSTYIKSLSDEVSKKEAEELIDIFEDITGMKPVMWGKIVGFGSYHYKYDSGREGDFLATGFAIRKSGPTIYILPGYNDYSKLMEKLGPHKLGKSCLYLKSLSDIDIKILKKIIKEGLKDLNKKYSVKST